MKKIAVLCALVLIFTLAGCGNDEKQSPAPDASDIEETSDAGTRNGEDIIDEGIEEIEVEEVLEDAKKPEQSDKPRQPGIETGVIKNAVKLEFDEKGNITKQCAVNILQLYTAEQLGLTPDIGHQLLFDASTFEIDGKACYTIVAKIPDGETEGVFYVSLDGSAAYKYDIENQQYIKLP